MFLFIISDDVCFRSTENEITFIFIFMECTSIFPATFPFLLYALVCSWYYLTFPTLERTYFTPPKKCPYSELFWFVFSHIRTKY